MAITSTFNASNIPVWHNTNTVSISPTDIKGEPIIVTHTVSQTTLEDFPTTDFDIKMELCNLLAKELFNKNCIDFTKEQRVNTGEYVFRARIFVTPKDVTQLLRTNGVIK